MRRYPFDAIEAHAGLGPRALAATLGLGERQVYRLRGRDLDPLTADGYATALGLHPAEVWPDWGTDLLRACERCPETFVPAVWNQRFCGLRCRTAAANERRAEDQLRWKRERYARDPEYAARKRAASAKQYAECGDYMRRARMARYYAQKESA